MIKSLKSIKFRQVFPYILVVGGIIGLLASGMLTIEKLHIAANPNYQPSCSLSPVVACSPVIASDEASAFGFPNPFIGQAGFAMVWAVGMMLLAGAKNLKKWFWWCFQTGSTFGMVFISWLIAHSLYDIGKLCIYCMMVWTVTIPIFFFTLSYNIREKNINIGGPVGRFLRDNPGKLVALTYLAVVLMVFFRFQDYWYSLI